MLVFKLQSDSALKEFSFPLGASQAPRNDSFFIQWPQYWTFGQRRAMVFRMAQLSAQFDPANVAPHLHPVQIAAWQKMSFEEKWSLACQANRMLRDGVRDRVRRQNPHLSEEQVEEETSRAILTSRP